MRILPWGRMLPVHCCCDPAKRLGWVPVPERRLEAPGPVRFILGHLTLNLETGAVTRPAQLDTVVAWLENCGAYPHGRQLAVKSADTPLDQWRKIPGFIEDTEETRPCRL
jgi:hypothetical protein